MSVARVVLGQRQRPAGSVAAAPWRRRAGGRRRGRRQRPPSSCTNASMSAKRRMRRQRRARHAARSGSAPSPAGDSPPGAPPAPGVTRAVEARQLERVLGARRDGCAAPRRRCRAAPGSAPSGVAVEDGLLAVASEAGLHEELDVAAAVGAGDVEPGGSPARAVTEQVLDEPEADVPGVAVVHRVELDDGPLVAVCCRVRRGRGRPGGRPPRRRTAGRAAGRRPSGMRKRLKTLTWLAVTGRPSERIGRSCRSAVVRRHVRGMAGASAGPAPAQGEPSGTAPRPRRGR